MNRVLVPLAEKGFVENDQAPLHFARETYIRRLVEHGLMPVFVSSKMTDEMIRDAYALCNGVLFMGGSDFNPIHYGKEKHPLTESSEPGRDRIELMIASLVLADEKPFIGICRGHQALVIASGGELEQHLPDLQLSESHGLSETQGYNNLFTDGPKHTVLITPETRLHKLVGVSQVTTNSAHHQAARLIGAGFLVSGRSPAGIIEMIEREIPTHFCIGIQSHPEAGEFLDPVFAAFADEVKNYHN